LGIGGHTVILATQEAEISSKPAWAQSLVRPYLEKPFTKIGLLKWLKVKVLSSNPSTAKRTKKQKGGQSGCGERHKRLQTVMGQDHAGHHRPCLEGIWIFFCE
jgi:hypothetical protein